MSEFYKEGVVLGEAECSARGYAAGRSWSQDYDMTSWSVMCEGRLGSSFYGNLPTRAPPSSKEAYSILFATCKPFLLTPPLSFYFHPLYSESSNLCLFVCFNVYLFGCGM